jgi:sugar lactone lactonase YvrE
MSSLYLQPRRSFRLLAPLLVLLSGLPASRSGAVPFPLSGDLNSDGKVNIADAVLLLRASVHLAALSPEQFNAADLNGDGLLSIQDAILLLNAISHGTAPLPLSAPPVTAHFSVDLSSGTVHQTDPSSRTKAVFGGSRVLFNTSTLLDEPGNTGVKVLNVSLTNTSGWTMGVDPNGTLRGTRLIFSDFANSFSDLRSHTQVSTLAGSGAAGVQDGPALAAAFGGPVGVAHAPDGSLYVTDYSNHTLRKLSNGQVSTLAGSGVAGSTDGAGPNASFNHPAGIAYNPTDGSLVVAEQTGNKLRRVTTDGVVTTLAGTGASGGTNGAGSTATFAGPWGVTVGSDGTIYVSEFSGHRIRKIKKTGSDPRLPASYTVSTLAGSGVAGVADGTGTAAQFNTPIGLAVDSGGTVYVAEYGNNKIRRIAATGEVNTIAGTGAAGDLDGPGNSAKFNVPGGIALVNGALIVSEITGRRLREITLKAGGSPTEMSNWTVRTLAGTGASGYVDGAGTVAQFTNLEQMASDAGGSVYLADFTNRRVRKVIVDDGYFPVGTPGGSPPSEPVQLSNADGRVGFNNGVSDLALPYLTYPGELDPGATSAAKEWDFSVPSGVSGFEFAVTVEAPTHSLAPPPSAVNAGSPDVWVRTYAGGNNYGFSDGDPVAARFSGQNPGLAVDASGNLYISEEGNSAIRRISASGQVTTIAGAIGGGTGSTDGIGYNARFYGPEGIVVTPDGSTLYVADFNNHTIRRLSLIGGDPAAAASWSVSTIAGLAGTPVGSLTLGTDDGVTGNNARFYNPTGLALDTSGSLYVTDFSGNRVRRVQYRGGDPSSSVNWFVTTIAGATDGSSGSTNDIGTSARFSFPWGIALDQAGNLYVADIGNHLIRKITDPETFSASVTTFAGSTNGYADGATTTAQFRNMGTMAVDASGYLYLVDWTNQRVRRISPGGVVTTVAGNGSGGGLDGSGDLATFTDPTGIAIDASGNLYVSDGSNGSRIRLIQRILQ